MDHRHRSTYHIIMILPLVFHPNDILRADNKNVVNFGDPSLTELIINMVETMEANNGIGIAAPQIGKNLQICIIHTEDGPLPLINPVITHQSFRKEWGEEGCLSIPHVFGDVKRHKSIQVKAQTPTGEEFEFKAEDLFARVIQHEVDHLNGVLFIDKAKNIREDKGRKGE